MKRMSILSFFTFYAISVYSQTNYALNNHTIVITGTSTMHDWTMNANKASGSGVFVLEANKIKSIQALQIEIPVSTIFSEKKSEKMDDKAQDALKKNAFPLIQYKLTEVNAIKQTEKGQQLTAKGIINVAGVTREEDLIVNSITNADGSIRFYGEKKLLMTNYNIKPPKAMMNLLSTGNEVNVMFDIQMHKI